MRKVMFTLSVVACAALLQVSGAGQAHASMQQRSHSMHSMATPASQGQMSQKQMFQARKGRLLQLINSNISHLEKMKTCVQSASSSAAMKGCLPHRRTRQGGNQKH